MKVGGPGAISNVGKAKGSSKIGGDGFSKFLDEAEETKETGGTATTSFISPVSFVNEVGADEKGKKRQLVEDGDDILDELTKIRNALLMGNISADSLRLIQGKVEKLEANCDDPSLNEIIEEIKIRAAVELAKLGF